MWERHQSKTDNNKESKAAEGVSLSYGPTSQLKTIPFGLRLTLAGVERRPFVETPASINEDETRAAHILGIAFSTLHWQIKR